VIGCKGALVWDATQLMETCALVHVSVSMQDPRRALLHGYYVPHHWICEGGVKAGDCLRAVPFWRQILLEYKLADAHRCIPWTIGFSINSAISLCVVPYILSMVAEDALQLN
jgi:hypothetical protein